MVRHSHSKASNRHSGRNGTKSWQSKRQTSLCQKDIKARKKWFCFLPVFLVVILGLAQIYLANRLGTQGRTLKKYEAEIQAMEEENRQIKIQTAKLTGLNTLSVLALEKGYVKNPPIINFSVKVPFALKSK